MRELLRALAVLAEPPTRQHAALLRLLGLPGSSDDAAYADAFLFQLYPYASVYLGPEGQLGGDARDRVAGFFRALGVAPPAEPDHLAVILSAYADLADREQEAGEPDAVQAWRVARTALLWEHLLTWVPLHLSRMHDVATEPYRSWAALVIEVLEHEAARQDPPTELPLALREAAALPDPRNGDTRAFLDGILAPARTGMVVLRDDLVRACRELDLGLRIGERRFVLAAMLDQEPASTIRWLADHARTTALTDDGWLAGVGDWWRHRAHGTADLLTDIAADARRFRAHAVAG